MRKSSTWVIILATIFAASFASAQTKKIATVKSNDVEAIKAIAKSYFVKLDTGSPDLFDLFTDDVKLYFPKFGVAQGKGALLTLATGFGKTLAGIKHDYDGFKYVVEGNTVIVEGTSSGKLKSGATWKAGETPAGRFVNIFEIENGKISRMYIYLDPDYAGTDKEHFLWGETLTDGRKW